MKFAKFRVTFERAVECVVLAPEGTSYERIQDLAKEIGSDGLQGWDTPSDWEAFVTKPTEVEEDDANLQWTQNKHGFRVAATPNVTSEDGALVLSDDREDFVDPTDASWCWTGRAVLHE